MPFSERQFFIPSPYPHLYRDHICRSQGLVAWYTVRNSYRHFGCSFYWCQDFHKKFELRAKHSELDQNWLYENVFSEAWGHMFRCILNRFSLFNGVESIPYVSTHYKHYSAANKQSLANTVSINYIDGKIFPLMKHDLKTVNFLSPY